MSIIDGDDQLIWIEDALRDLKMSRRTWNRKIAAKSLLPPVRHAGRVYYTVRDIRRIMTNLPRSVASDRKPADA